MRLLERRLVVGLRSRVDAAIQDGRAEEGEQWRQRQRQRHPERPRVSQDTDSDQGLQDKGVAFR